MNLSRKWLEEFVHVDASDKDFAEAMTLSGSKVELTHDLGAEISHVVAGVVTAMERHPDSDHMWVCQVDVGQAGPVQIVTGAWNVHVGDMVPVALDGSSLPGGKKIEKGRLRGVESNGMMCGLYELGLDERDFPYARHRPRRHFERLPPPGQEQALHLRRHPARRQGVRARGVRPDQRRCPP